ncbi:F-box protein At3g07870-like isoform X2 [Hibiscus syriacus]|uniref:F-box protein At3g07870-like isoform X2 n=1 Tax=Hibiscus syriacus TaxID=106335 RepID=UPI001920E2D9|nr:F-box protein At3g07870-like isoform X2 [Hibiscus syriacus]
MMDRLPHDVILEILSRLPITTLVQSKSVCRSWRSIIGGSLLANKHLLHMAENDPCIIFQSHSLIQNQYYFVDFAAFSEGNKSLKKIQASTMHATLVGSSNGLLCFDNISQIHTCNPLTGDLVELPKLARNPGELGILGFGFSPTKKEYKVVEIAYQRRRFRTESYHPASNSFQPWVRILTLGGSQWRSLGMVSYKFVRPISQVIVSGRLHWITQPGIIMNNRVISFDLTAEQFQEVPQPDYGTLNKQFYELVVLRGHLCAAVPNASLGLDIWVMKEYNVKESWVKEFIIGGSLPEEIHSIPATRSEFRAVCRFRSGEILLEHRSKSFFLYDPVNEKFENLVLKGVPNWSKTVVHVGSLVSI